MGWVELHGNGAGWAASIQAVLDGIVADFVMHAPAFRMALVAFIGASILVMIVNRVVKQ